MASKTVRTYWQEERFQQQKKGASLGKNCIRRWQFRQLYSMWLGRFRKLFPE